MNSIQKTARMAGLMYLLFIVFSFVADKFACFALGDITVIVNKIIANEWLFRIGLISNLFSALFFLLAAWALYVLLKPVNKNFALLFLLLNSVGVAIHCLSVINLFAGLQLLGGTEYLNVFRADQLQAQAMFFISLYDNGFIIAQIFYGIWLFPLGFLVFKSHLFPGILGILLMIDCFAILIWFFQFFLFPDYEVLSYPGLGVSVIAEFGLTLWLLIKGVKIQHEDTQTPTSY
jgi:hypothetical protein